MGIVRKPPNVRIVGGVVRGAARYDTSVRIGPRHDYPQPTRSHVDVDVNVNVDVRDAVRGPTSEWGSARDVRMQLFQPGPGDTPRRQLRSAPTAV